MTRTAVVLGCGGTIGGVWIVAALASLVEQTGFQPGDADVLQGTSAGAELVTMLGSGVSVSDLVEMHRGRAHDSRLREHLAATPPAAPPLPELRILNPSLAGRRRGLERLTGLAPVGRGDPQWLTRLAASYAGEGWLPHPDARMVAYDVKAGKRVTLSAATDPAVTVDQALRASWAIPGWMPPVPIGEQILVDGGAASTASVDLLAPHDADLIYVIAPMASATGVRAPGVGGVVEHRLLRKEMSSRLATEIATVRQRGTRVVPILPTKRDLVGLGSNFMSRAHRAAAFESSMQTAQETVRVALRKNGVSS